MGLFFVVAIGVMDMALVLAGACVLSPRVPAVTVKRILLSYCTSCLCYVMLEFVFFVREGFTAAQAITVYDRPCAAFDPVAGYRWQPGVARILRIVGNEVAYDQRFRANNCGYISSRDYTYRKPRRDVKRIVVLGDSFSAGDYLSVPLPDRLHELLQSGMQEEPIRYEVYSFALPGQGLQNWHSIFFREIAPKYEFDAVIIACYLGDFARAFTIFHHTQDRAYFGRFPDPPKTADGFRARCLPRMTVYAQIQSGQTMDRMVAAVRAGRDPGWRWPGVNLYATRLLYRRVRNLVGANVATDQTRRLQGIAEGCEPCAMISREQLNEAYGGRLVMLWEMLEYCKRRRVPVLLVSIPSREACMARARRCGAGQNVHQLELLSIAKLYGVEYFDGYKAFAGEAPETIDSVYWLRLDGHWSQEGSDLLAEALAGFVRSEWFRRFGQRAIAMPGEGPTAVAPSRVRASAEHGQKAGPGVIGERQGAARLPQD